MQEVPAPTENVAFLRCSEKHHDIVLQQGEPGLKRVAFELESEAQLAVAEGRLRNAGIAFEPIPASECDAMFTGPGIRTRDPGTDCAVDLYIDGSTAAGVPAFEPTVAKILRLGHLVLGSQHYESSLDFFVNVLNFKVSDMIGEMITFLRCFPNPYHHSFGIGNAKFGSGLHHVAFMVSDIDDIVPSYWRLQNSGVSIVQGPGKHLPSGSIFLYFLDPDDLTLEYTLGMEEFSESDPRAPRSLLPVPETIDVWSSRRDPRMGTTGSVETRETAGEPGAS